MLALFFAAYVVLSAVDGILTHRLLSTRDDLAEGNPVARFFITQLGLTGGIFIPKVVIALALHWIIFHGGGWPLAYAASAVMAFVVIHNARLMR